MAYNIGARLLGKTSFFKINMIRKEVYTRGNFAAKEFMRLCKSINQTSEYISGKKAKKIRQALRIYDATQLEFNKVLNRENES